MTNCGQEIDPLAFLHHEFGHTRFGADSRNDVGTLEDGFIAIKRNETPVRALASI